MSRRTSIAVLALGGGCYTGTSGSSWPRRSPRTRSNSVGEVMASIFTFRKKSRASRDPLFHVLVALPDGTRRMVSIYVDVLSIHVYSL